ncbi:MAG: lamin tail domain-containing protein [Candidatus Azobacteroides sp.]|nr:lamin tail domain-containing protein [Candidatus Azobacteroides sp.]
MHLKLPMKKNVFYKRAFIYFLLSLFFGGTAISQNIFINEISGNDKWLELYNSGDSEINISGYNIVKVDELGEESLWEIPAGSKIPARGFISWERDQYNPAYGFTWGISARKNVAFRLINNSGEEIDYFEIRHELFSEGEGRTVGRETDGGEKLVIFKQGTKNASNSGGIVLDKTENPDRIVINEISGNEKWFEIYNAEDKKVNLTGYRILKIDETGAGNFWDIPAGTEIGPKGYLSWKQDADKTDGSTFTWGISARRNVVLKIYDSNFTAVDYFEIGHELFSEGEERTVGYETDGGGKLIIFSKGSREASNSSGTILTPTENPKQIYVNEISGNEKWLEIYNAEKTEVNLTGYSLLKIDEYGAGSFWQIPSGTTIPADGFLYWTQGDNEEQTFTWGISARKDVAFKVYDNNFTALDYFEVKMPGLYSEGGQQTVGRKTDGAEELQVFLIGTPGASNGKANSINEFSVSEKTIIYVQDKTLYFLEDVMYLSVVDLSGKNILTSETTKENDRINLSFLANGIYILKMETNNGIKIAKILLE